MVATPNGVTTTGVKATVTRLNEGSLSTQGQVDLAVWNDFPLKKDFPKASETHIIQ